MELAFYEQVTKQDAANLSYYNIIQGIICICVLIIAHKIYMHYKRKFQNMMAALNNKIMLLQSEQAAQLKIINTTKNKVETCAHMNNTTMTNISDTMDIMQEEINENSNLISTTRREIEDNNNTLTNIIKGIIDDQDSAIETAQVTQIDRINYLARQQNDSDKQYNELLSNQYSIILLMQEELKKQNLALSMLNNLDIDMPICIGVIREYIHYTAYEYDSSRNFKKIEYIKATPLYVSSLVEALNIDDYSTNNGIEISDMRVAMDIVTLYGENFKYLKQLKVFKNTRPIVNNIGDKGVLKKCHKQFLISDIPDISIEHIEYDFSKLYCGSYGMLGTAININSMTANDTEYNPGENQKLLDSIDSLPKFANLKEIKFTNMHFESPRLFKILKTMNFEVLEQTYHPADINVTRSIHAFKKE
jgi:hypothetical protein